MKTIPTLQTRSSSFRYDGHLALHVFLLRAKSTCTGDFQFFFLRSPVNVSSLMCGDKENNVKMRKL